MRGHLTYSNVVATICLFIVLGGGAYAASTQLSKNSVGPKQIRAGAVRSSEVKDRSLLAQDFKPGQLPAGKDGAPGPPGATGSVRAYGLVTAAGQLVASVSKNLSVIKIKAQAGAYCVLPLPSSGIDPTTVEPLASSDLPGGVGSVHIVQISSTTFYPAEGPAASGWEIYTQTQQGSGFFENKDSGFSILIP
jgi:hypothetical protein